MSWVVALKMLFLSISFPIRRFDHSLVCFSSMWALKRRRTRASWRATCWAGGFGRRGGRDAVLLLVDLTITLLCCSTRGVASESAALLCV